MLKFKNLVLSILAVSCAGQQLATTELDKNALNSNCNMMQTDLLTGKSIFLFKNGFFILFQLRYVKIIILFTQRRISLSESQQRKFIIVPQMALRRRMSAPAAIVMPTLANSQCRKELSTLEILSRKMLQRAA